MMSTSSTSKILTEGRVSTNILSFAEHSFLFTGTVCKTWNTNSGSTKTSAEEAVQSLSRIDEACQSGINPYLASFWSLKCGASMPIIQKLNEQQSFWEQDDLEYAAEQGRVDVLQFMRERGFYTDERVLHTAVRFNQVEVAKYLLDNDTPIDKTPIEWGFGPYIIDELKMRSLEVAISSDNLPMVKVLRTADFPFIDDSFTFACDNENIQMMEYLVEEDCRIPMGLFAESVSNQDYFTLDFLISKGLLREEWDLWSCVVDGDEGMVRYLISKGIMPTDDDVDSAIAGAQLHLARFLTTNYMCRPTSLAYMLVFENPFCDCHCREYLDWLYDNMQCSLGFVRLEDMQADMRGAFVLENCSDDILEWFRERLY